MSSRLFRLVRATACAAVATSALASFAQTDTAVTASRTVPYYDGPRVSRFDIYGGYGYLHPVNSDINNFQYLPINPGAVTSVAGYFTRNLGVQVEGSFFPHGPDDCVFTAQAGPIFRIQRGRFVPFVHVLGGGAKVGGPVFQPCTWGWGVTGGIGFDYIVPKFDGHLAIRPIQADFEYSQVNYGPLIVPAGVSGGLGDIQGYRLSAGLVLRLGNMVPPAPMALSCSVQPAEGFPGDPMTVTATATNLNPKKPAMYTWTSNGGQVAGPAAVATLDTRSTPAGSYAVTGHITQGAKPYQTAECTAPFTLHAFEPPTISCTANPSTLMPGDTSTITSSGMSPQNRALTYSYVASAGQVTGNGASASLATSGAVPGSTITVTCNVVDDLGKTATATTAVNVTAPPAAPAPQPSDLCSVSFDRDRKRPDRVDNEGKACLDDVALALQRQSDAKLVIVGNGDSSDKSDSAAERAYNVELYLTQEKGIDASRIELRTGTAGTRSVMNTLLPAGASFPADQTTPVDPSTLTHHGQPYGKPKPH